MRLGESGSDFLFNRGKSACVGREGVGEQIDNVEGRCAGSVEALPLRINERSVGVLLCLRELKLCHVWSHTAALRSSSFQKARSRIQLTRTTEVASEAFLRAEMANRDVSQFALQPSVLVRRVRDCAGGRARYGSRVEGVRLRCDEAILVV